MHSQYLSICSSSHTVSARRSHFKTNLKFLRPSAVIDGNRLREAPMLFERYFDLLALRGNGFDVLFQFDRLAHCFRWRQLASKDKNMDYYNSSHQLVFTWVVRWYFEVNRYYVNQPASLSKTPTQGRARGTRNGERTTCQYCV